MQKIPRPSAEKLAFFYGPPSEAESAKRVESGAGITRAVPNTERERLTRAFTAPQRPAPPVEEEKPVDPYAVRQNAEMMKGNSLMNAGLYRQAVVHWKMMQQKYPCDSRVTLKLGLAYKELREYSAAHDYIRKAIAQGAESHRYTAILSELKSLSRSYSTV